MQQICVEAVLHSGMYTLWLIKSLLQEVYFKCNLFLYWKTVCIDRTNVLSNTACSYDSRFSSLLPFRWEHGLEFVLVITQKKFDKKEDYGI